MKHFAEMGIGELKAFLSEIEEPPFRATQLLEWYYKKGQSDFMKMNNLPLSLREKLSQQFTSPLFQEGLQVSQDQETTKFLWKLHDESLVESVLIEAPGRKTVCVSSQVGCPARCAFCASGKEGLIRNLSPVEIAEQVFAIDRFLKGREEKVTHVVFMGMGEPLENYDSVIAAISMLTDEKRLGLSERKITVSTVGVVPNILRFTEENIGVHLVLSLHAPNQHIRKKIIPYARKYDIGEILQAMLFFAKKTKRDITYEYTMLDGINDQREHAEELAKLVKDHPCTVNLIPYNPVTGLNLKRPSGEKIEKFREILERNGINVTWRYTKGKDIAAACGQLALQKKSENRLLSLPAAERISSLAVVG